MYPCGHTKKKFIRDLQKTKEKSNYVRTKYKRTKMKKLTREEKVNILACLAQERHMLKEMIKREENDNKKNKLTIAIVKNKIIAYKILDTMK